MSKPSFTQSQKRLTESLGALFSKEGAAKKLLFLKSSSDEGVIRNGGRNGARYAPRSLLAAFKRLTQDNAAKDWSFEEFEVASQYEEEQDFEAAQKSEAERIKRVLQQHPGSAICHLGGGHDHVRPLLLALSQNYKKIVVLNIDAHADTRTDESGHSGTPFRQFAREQLGAFRLFEIGLHPYANSFSTLSELEKGRMDVLWRSDLLDSARTGAFFNEIRKCVDKETLVVFSLDADGLHGSEVPGVSAVNADGLSRKELKDLWEEYLRLVPHAPILGIYELNPVYDGLSMMSMRTMATFLFETLK